MRLMPAICHLAGLKVRTPIMIDWSDLGRKRGLPLLTWATAHDELNPSQNRLEAAFIARLLRNLSMPSVRCCWPIEASDAPVCCAGYRKCPATPAARAFRSL